MENSHVIDVLHEISKLLDLGNIPKAKQQVEGTLEILVREEAKKQGKLFQLINIPQMTETETKNPLLQRDFELANKLNEVCAFLNHRFSK